MTARLAAGIFLGICLTLAALLAAGIITPVISGGIFAVSLAGLGIASGGFRNK